MRHQVERAGASAARPDPRPLEIRPRVHQGEAEAAVLRAGDERHGVPAVEIAHGQQIDGLGVSSVLDHLVDGVQRREAAGGSPGGAPVAAGVDLAAVQPAAHRGGPDLRPRAHGEAADVAPQIVGEASPGRGARDPAEDAPLAGGHQERLAVGRDGGEGRGAGLVDRAALVPDRPGAARLLDGGGVGQAGLEVPRLDRPPVDAGCRAMTAFDPPDQRLALGAAALVPAAARRGEARRRQSLAMHQDLARARSAPRRQGQQERHGREGRSQD